MARYIPILVVLHALIGVVAGTYDLIDDLERLDRLHDKGSLSEDEFKRAKEAAIAAAIGNMAAVARTPRRVSSVPAAVDGASAWLKSDSSKIVFGASADTDLTRAGTGHLSTGGAFSLGGFLKVGMDAAASCDADAAGTLRWSAADAKLLLCDGTEWGGVGGSQMAEDNDTCNADKAGAVRYQDGVFQGCDSVAWFTLLGQPTHAPTLPPRSPGSATFSASDWTAGSRFTFGPGTMSIAGVEPDHCAFSTFVVEGGQDFAFHMIYTSMSYTSHRWFRGGVAIASTLPAASSKISSTSNVFTGDVEYYEIYQSAGGWNCLETGAVNRGSGSKQDPDVEVMIKRLDGVLTCWVNGQHEGTYNDGQADLRDMRFLIMATGGHGSTAKDMRW